MKRNLKNINWKRFQNVIYYFNISDFNFPKPVLEVRVKEGREPVDLRFCETESWKKVLGVKTEAGFNEFIITLDPGYLSIGEENGLNDTEDMEFCMNSEYEKFLVSNYAVIPISQAKEAIVEFFKIESLPTVVKWEEL